jgi:hypothetical protein
MPGLLAAGFFLTVITAIGHWAGRIDPQKNNFAFPSEIALSLALFAVAMALSIPGTSAVGLSLFWFILLVEEGWAWRIRLFRVFKDSNEPVRFREGEAPAEPQARERIASHYSARLEPRPPEGKELISETMPPEEVTQQLTRSLAVDGTEELAGWLRIPFAAGQRTGSAHLAFCPPFAHTPELNFEQLDGPEARLKTVQILPYGARVDLKLHAASELPAGVVLHFSARAEPARSFNPAN